MYLKYGGGGGCNVVLAFYAISNISKKKKNSGNKKKNLFIFLDIVDIGNFMLFSKLIFFGERGGGDIEKCPFTYWLNGRWFLQIVDIGNFNMKLNGI